MAIMIYRVTLVSLTAAFMLSACSKSSTVQQTADFSSGPTQINVSHIVTPADDGSSVFITVDGQEAGKLDDGQHKELHVTPGSHQIGGYVRTLLGRVTIPAVDVTTSPDEVTQVTYSVKDKPIFSKSDAPQPTPTAG